MVWNTIYERHQTWAYYRTPTLIRSREYFYSLIQKEKDKDDQAMLQSIYLTKKRTVVRLMCCSFCEFLYWCFGIYSIHNVSNTNNTTSTPSPSEPICTSVPESQLIHSPCHYPDGPSDERLRCDSSIHQYPFQIKKANKNEISLY